ncbi:hypothetical protein PIB30_080565 [Stylosanthes scabra]|uniref:Uncharacterized protein n=1 Tax=Stylosanthes scabra TaxID=79078 RepID=A0ABU6WPQ3_9FABA|nr:hypothetical protein [Stylosanthes scabra]
MVKGRRGFEGGGCLNKGEETLVKSDGERGFEVVDMVFNGVDMVKGVRNGRPSVEWWFGNRGDEGVVWRLSVKSGRLACG